MLSIASEILPQTGLSYTAFRLAFSETLERLTLSRQLGELPEGFGFLTEVPFLKAVPPRVQLDLLAETWAKHSGVFPVAATLVDESVIYAICETSSRLIAGDPATAKRYLQRGPVKSQPKLDVKLAGEIRSLHTRLSNAGDFLLISQFEDMHPDEARKLKREFRMDEARLDDLFDVLGRWHASPDFHKHLAGLLTPREIARTSIMLGGPRDDFC